MRAEAWLPLIGVADSWRLATEAWVDVSSSKRSLIRYDCQMEFVQT